jgi:hypothetical protein
MWDNVKIYTVHVRGDDRGVHHKPVFVKEGFNFLAFVVPLPYALYKRLWMPALAMLAFNVLLVFMMRHQVLGAPSISALDLGFRIIVGFQANDWVRVYLQKAGYILSDISAADSLLRAEQRYFERYLVAAAPAK